MVLAQTLQAAQHTAQVSVYSAVLGKQQTCRTSGWRCPSIDCFGIRLWVAGGLDGITIFQKGLPLAFNNAIPNYTASFGGGSRPNVLAGCNKSPGVGGSAKLGEWFDTSCFTAPADFTYGNKSRADPRLRSSGVNNWDFALFKKTMFGPDDRL